MNPQPPLSAGAGKSSGFAIASLVCGLASLIASILTGIPAVICGHLALKQIKMSQGTLRGGGMAITGLIMGYLSILFLIILIPLSALAAPVFVRAQAKAEQTRNMSSMKQVHTALILYDQDFGCFPDQLEDLLNPEYGNGLESLDGLAQWTYIRPGQSMVGRSRDILMAHPDLYNDERLVLRVDGSVERLQEAEYQARVKAQQEEAGPSN